MLKLLRAAGWETSLPLYLQCFKVLVAATMGTKIVRMFSIALLISPRVNRSALVCKNSPNSCSNLAILDYVLSLQARVLLPLEGDCIKKTAHKYY